MNKIICSLAFLFTSISISAQAKYDIFTEETDATTGVKSYTITKAMETLQSETSLPHAFWENGIEVPATETIISTEDIDVYGATTVYVCDETSWMKYCPENHTNAIIVGTENGSTPFADDFTIENLSSIKREGQSMLTIKAKKSGKFSASILTGVGNRSVGIYQIPTDEEKAAGNYGKFLTNITTDYGYDVYVEGGAPVPALEAELEAGREYWIVCSYINMNLYKLTYKANDTEEGSGSAGDTISSADITSMDNVIYAVENESFDSVSTTISIRMKHSMLVSGFQADVVLPASFTVTNILRGDGLMAKDNQDEYVFTFSTSEQADGSHRIQCYSISSDTVPAGDIEVAKLSIEIPLGVEPGRYSITVKNAEMAYNTESVLIDAVNSVYTVKDYLIGDANHDRVISVADITAISQYLHGSSPTVFDLQAADANEDGRVSIADITTLAYQMHNNASVAEEQHLSTISSLYKSPRTTVSSQHSGTNLILAEATIEAGKEVVIPVVMTGKSSGFQFNVMTPEGITLTNILRGEETEIENANKEKVFSLSNSTKIDGSHFVLCYSTNAQKNDEGEVVRLVFNVDSSLSAGDYSILLSNIECAHAGVVLNTYTEQHSKIVVKEATGISDVIVDTMQEGDIYHNLQGIRVENPSQGIYINNGKKVILK